MGFFSSSRSHLETLETDCRRLTELSGSIRRKCDDSLRGKYEYASPEERATLMRDGLTLSKALRDTLAAAKERQQVMEQDQCSSEDLLAAQSLLLAASMDAQRAEKALDEARQSLLAGIAEIEAFYGPRSKEAKELRRVLADFQPTGT